MVMIFRYCILGENYLVIAWYSIAQRVANILAQYTYILQFQMGSILSLLDSQFCCWFRGLYHVVPQCQL